jgi:lipopolysaccharide export system protein LptA
MTLAAVLALAALAAPPQPPPVKPAAAGVRGSAAAQAAAAEGPVRVDADEFTYAFQKRQVVFTGKPVVLTRGDARLTCERLVADNDARGQIARAVCSGDVRFVRGERLVTCERATYDAVAARLVCEGNPVLREGTTEARGTRLVYELRSDVARLEGARVTLPGAEVDQRRRELEERRRGGTP